MKDVDVYIQKFKRKLVDLRGDGREIVIWGTKSQGILLYVYMKQFRINVLGFCDNDPEKHGKTIYDGKLCLSPSELEGNIAIAIGIKNEEKEETVAEQVRRLGFSCASGFQNLMEYCKGELSDEEYVKYCWYGGMGYELDLEHPKTFNEKMQYLKLRTYYDNPTVTACVDKLLVKEWLKNSDCKTAHTYGVYNHAEEIDWAKLPEQFVLKCNHGCGYNIICTDKSQLDRDQAVKLLNKWIEEDFWLFWGEPQYKFIEKKIFAEEYLGAELVTYKFYCFKGIPRIAYVSHNGEAPDFKKDMYLDFFDMDFVWQDITLEGHPHYPHAITRPECWKQMIGVAQNLAVEFPFVRVDLYNVDENIYLSELTFIPTGGYMRLSPDNLQIEWGKWL